MRNRIERVGTGYASLAEECTGEEGREDVSWERPSFVIMTVVLPPAVGCGLGRRGWSKAKGSLAAFAEWEALG